MISKSLDALPDRRVCFTCRRRRTCLVACAVWLLGQDAVLFTVVALILLCWRFKQEFWSTEWRKLRRGIHVHLIQVFFVFAWRQIVLDDGDTSAFHSYGTDGWICRVINHQKSGRFCACRWVVMWSRWNNGLSLGNGQKYVSRANLSIHFFINLNYFVPISVTHRI